MGNISDIIFQILLFVIGIMMGFLPVLYPDKVHGFKNSMRIASYVVVAIACFWAGYQYSTSQQQLRFYVSNKLAQSIYVYANGDYQGMVPAGKTVPFSRLSAQDFPITVRWEIKKIHSLGDEMGEIIRRVDVAQTVVVDNQIGQTTYFHPVISNNLDQNCKISVNDATRNESKAGFINAHSQNVTPGYFIWRDDSNVTLYCNDQPMWLGIRRGNDKSRFLSLPEPGDGNLVLTFFKPNASP